MSDLEPCVQCGERFPASELLFHDSGRICRICEIDTQAHQDLSRAVLRTAAAGPVMALTGTLLLFSVCLLGPIAPFSGIFFGAWALVLGVKSVRLAWTAGDDEEQVAQFEKVMLYVSGALSLLWSGGLIVGGCLGMGSLFLA